jgi:hypothetical protein
MRNTCGLAIRIPVRCNLGFAVSRGYSSLCPFLDHEESTIRQIQARRLTRNIYPRYSPWSRDGRPTCAEFTYLFGEIGF